MVSEVIDNEGSDMRGCGCENCSRIYITLLYAMCVSCCRFSRCFYCDPYSITGYGSTLYIGIAMVFVFSPYIWKFTFCFQFQLTFNDFTAQNMSKVICVPKITLNYNLLS